jgi:ABC-type transporter MlaC component
MLHSTAAFLLILSLASTAWALTPAATLQQVFADANRILSDPETVERPLERFAAAEKLVASAFDFGGAAELALGRRWQSLSTVERQEFARLFGGLLGRSYLARMASRVGLDGGMKVQGRGASVDGHEAIIRTAVVRRDGSEIPLDYRMIERDGRWKVRDVIIDGISMAENYRAQLDRVLATSSVAGLLAQMQAKIDALEPPLRAAPIAVAAAAPVVPAAAPAVVPAAAVVVPAAPVVTAAAPAVVPAAPAVTAAAPAVTAAAPAVTAAAPAVTAAAPAVVPAAPVVTAAAPAVVPASDPIPAPVETPAPAETPTISRTSPVDSPPTPALAPPPPIAAGPPVDPPPALALAEPAPAADIATPVGAVALVAPPPAPAPVLQALARDVRPIEPPVAFIPLPAPPVGGAPRFDSPPAQADVVPVVDMLSPDVAPARPRAPAAAHNPAIAATPMIAQAPPPAAVTAAPSTPAAIKRAYWLLIGKFSSVEAAGRLAARVLGSQVVMTPKGPNAHRQSLLVRLGPFADAAVAVSRLLELQTKGHNPFLVADRE